ncbi:MAG: hypothetical protein U1A27_12700 [Phycisphaerae bacterium]
MDAAAARILDANFNRAGEALRVLEEHARFALNDAATTAAVKSLRHALRGLRERFPAGALLDARDTPRDVGTQISTPDERVRGSTESVAVAARGGPARRRVIEEYAKLCDAGVGACRR